MSVPPKVLCRTGCGDVGDPELEFFCGDCYGDKIAIGNQKALLDYLATKQTPTHETLPNDAPGDRTDPLSQRRKPPKVDHRKAFEDFLLRPREKDEMVVARECLFLEREAEICATSRAQLRRYMIATDRDEAVDPKEWGRYQYGAPHDVPRNDVDHATEIAAQLRLFCHYRKRTVARRIMTRKQLNDQQRDEDANAKKAFSKSQRKSTLARLVPRLSTPTLSIRLLTKKKPASARVLSIVDTDDTPKPAPGNMEDPKPLQREP